jgi:hypothetical protein
VRDAAVHVVITYKRRIFQTAGTVAKQNADTIIFANDPAMNATNARTQPDYATHSIHCTHLAQQSMVLG